MKSTLRFLGAAGHVTGSRHLLETRGRRLLIDCGLFQGPKENRLKNWNAFPVEAKSIDAVLLTHAHIDHIGYQAEGTRGRALLDGKPTLRMFGQDIAVRARILSIHGFSGHADYQEILAWLMAFNKPVETVFLVHGEPPASEALGARIHDQFGWPAKLPREGQSFDLDL